MTFAAPTGGCRGSKKLMARWRICPCRSIARLANGTDPAAKRGYSQGWFCRVSGQSISEGKAGVVPSMGACDFR